MHEPFRSPTVDLWMPPDDFITFVSAIERYRALGDVFREDLEESRKIGYPVALLGGDGLPDIRVYFQHFKSVSQGGKAWTRRFERFDPNKAMLVLAQKSDVTESHLRAFDALQFAKIAFTHKPYPDIASAAWVPGLRPGDVGDLFGSWWRLVFALSDRRLRKLREAIEP